MTGQIFTKIYPPPDVDLSEILRYAGCSQPTDDVMQLINEALSEAKQVLSYKVCYGEFPVNISNETVDLGFAAVQSENLAKYLSNCKSIVLFAATVGLGFDRLIAKYSSISPAKALIMQAVGAERIESLCNVFCRDIGNKICCEYSKHTKPRFSPGYGDVPLSLQTDIFRVLDCYKHIGLSLNESLIMSPSKSVTAIIGITDTVPAKSNKKCDGCCNDSCPYRSI